MTPDLHALAAQIRGLDAHQPMGRVAAVGGGVIEVAGLGGRARTGDRLELRRRGQAPVSGEVIHISEGMVRMLPDTGSEGVSLGDPVILRAPAAFSPCDAWIGRVIDPDGGPLDGRPLPRGRHPRALRAPPPPAARRRSLGGRLETGLAVLNTLLPVVKGQRLGLFAGSGVGKSNLIAELARNMQADVVVVALIGERGREVGEFVADVLGPAGMKRAVVVAATSDQSPLMRRRCAWAAMTVAEHFRDSGRDVLLLADSLTRMAEAHREIAVSSGEPASMRGYPASLTPLLMSLCERAGPGVEGQGHITALFSVLVAGSDMEEPVADILRGTLDGHLVLSREIAERGRFPALDVARSVSRSLPGAASESENDLISETRRLLGAYEGSEMMIRAGLYAPGSDPVLDQAVRIWPDVDAFIAQKDTQGIDHSFSRLQLILRRAQGGSIG